MHILRRFWSTYIALLAVNLAGASPATATPLAELFAMQTKDGVLLHGLHYRPARESHTVVIHLPGGPGAFYSPQDMAPLAEVLTRNDIHFLSVNLRTAGTKACR